MSVFHLVLIASVLVVVAGTMLAYEPDISKFPADPATFPSHLENMRPGQIRDAAAQGAVCLLPVGTMEAEANGGPLGMDAAAFDAVLAQLAAKRKAVIAPPIWYGPTGYIVSGPDGGTFDMPARAFSHYLQEVIVTLQEIGFKRVEIVPMHNPQGDESPLRSAIDFAMGDIFNNLWKDPNIGANWWIRPDRDQVNWSRVGIARLPAPAKAAAMPATAPAAKLLRLENMTSAQLGDALKRGLPCVLPVGVLENHGNHNPIGCDAIEAQDPALLAAEQVPCVLAPTIWYGPTANAVTGPKLATTDINGHVFQEYASGVVEGLAALGFKNIVILQCHQGGGAEVTGLKLAIAEYRAGLHRKLGPGWAGKAAAPRISLVNPLGNFSDHASKNETGWMLRFRPEYTDLGLLRENDYPYCWDKAGPSNAATTAWGQEMCDKVVPKLVKVIQEHTADKP